MASTTARTMNTNQRHIVVTVFYLIAVSIITHTLLTEHKQVANYVYVYPICMLIAYFISNTWIRRASVILSFALIMIVSFIEPLDLQNLSQSFILVPLCYLAISPGSLWPIAAAIILIGNYFLTINDSQIVEFAEASIELFTIALLATGGTYYKHKLGKQIETYRKDSLTDCLTQLYNRKAFQQDLEKLSRLGCHKNALKYALLLVDLDDFKQINDLLGHQLGDEILIQFSKRLSNLEFKRINIYRVNGDEFAILLQHPYDVKYYAQQTADYLQEASQQEFHLGKRTYSLTVCIGIAALEDSMYDANMWCRNADIAIKRAKLNAKNKIQWFDDSLIDETVRNYQIERELGEAIEHNQLTLYYQPKVDVKTNQLHSAEALIRWNHPELGLIKPDEFVGVAERSQQIIPIGHWVINTACHQAKAWHDAGHNICVAVNVSTVQFMYDDMFHVVTKALQDSDLEPHLLQLEITETTLMKQPERVVDACNDLRTLGIRVAIDDFGVAYSSLNYLKQLPIDVLKIDKSFIDECCTNHNNRMLVRTIIQLGHNMGKTVTAEGVVNSDQLNLLAQEECDEYQGYLFSKPVPPFEFLKLLNIQGGAPSAIVSV